MKFIHLSIRFLLNICLIIVITSSCGRNNEYVQPVDNKILKIGDISLNKSEFEKCEFLLKQSDISSEDSLLIKTISLLYKKATLLSFLKQTNYQLNEEENANLVYKNKVYLINMAITALTSDIKISKRYAQQEYKRADKKQVLIDYIWLPRSNTWVINQCFSFLQSGGNIIDLINSRKEIYNQIFYELNGKLKRINVKPGEFCGKISKFIYLSDIGDTKIIKTHNGYHIIKIIYRKKDDREHIDFNEFMFNLKKTKYLESDKSPITKLLKKNKLYCDFGVIDSIDFSIKPLLINDSSDIIAEFNGQQIQIDDISNKINKLSYVDKISFNSISCKPLAIATLILLDNNCKVFTSEDLISDFTKNQLECGLKGMSLKECINSDFYKILKKNEETLSYPWLYPSLIKESNLIKINYDKIYKTQFVKIMPYSNDDILATYKNHKLKVAVFLKEFDLLSRETQTQILKQDNAIKMIHYCFNEMYKCSSDQINVNIPLLENILLDNSRKFSIYDISENNLSNYSFYNEDTTIINIDDQSINIKELRKIISVLPKNQRFIFSHYWNTINELWRVIGMEQLLEEQIWINEAWKLNLQNSQKFKSESIKNEQNALIKSFLSSLTKIYEKDKINEYLEGIITKDKTAMDIQFDSTYFKNNLEQIDNMLIKNQIQLFN